MILLKNVGYVAQNWKHRIPKYSTKAKIGLSFLKPKGKYRNGRLREEIGGQIFNAKFKTL